ncbi:DNA-binding transcriptional regulator, MarR family [Pseudonocardia thermophila]|jgi:Transcriptional regulators|uniref:DNA-binding transcriptional regulator, MarR family n=1 Tax=Pseudonocardia thermophila TaxID=1848 RepID=A0A1M6QKW5_PSETH|nr:MarR family transcriptional regulator [Pseudonocardia thermophila]SHK20815.1 DNA-binding transcriptional regulator, MarR family [Pseudonocardia thermophila]
MSSALHAELGDALRRFIANVVLHNQKVAQELGLGASDSQFISLLQTHGPLTPGRLAELSGLTTGSVTGVLDRLEKGGYVRRERDPHDRRKVIVDLVPAAAARLAEHYREHGEQLAAVMARRSDEELAVILRFFDDLLAE